MTAYYNEFDPKAAAWLRELIKAGHIAPGDVDERSIVDIRPSDLIGYTQCHFFAGIGVWSYALRRAGWPDDRPVWTGSCPCQPFSAAGKGAGFTDERHLWPHFHWLIENCRPPVVFGEQVASKDGLGWLDLVQADLEGSGYASGAVDTCAAGFGAPHIRQRLYWVAHSDKSGSQGRCGVPERTAERAVGSSGLVDGLADSAGVGRIGRWAGGEGHKPGEIERSERLCYAGGLAHDNDDRRIATPSAGFHNSEHHAEPCGGSSGLANADGRNPIAERQQRGGEQRFLAEDGSPLREGCEGARSELGGLAHPELQQRPGSAPGDYEKGGRHEEPAEIAGLRGHRGSSPTNGFWRDVDWLFCRDRKWRPVEPGTFPLAHGVAKRMVVVCSCCKTETRWMSGASDEANPVEVLQILRFEDGTEKTAVRRVGGIELFQQAPVLQPTVFRFLTGENTQDERGSAYAGAPGVPEGFMQSLRRNRVSTGSPPRSESLQQCTKQSGSTLYSLPSGGTREADAAIYLRSLRNLVRCQKSSEQKQDLFCPVCEGIRSHECRQEMVSRVSELRGYGNAIVAPAAQAFIEAYLETEIVAANDNYLSRPDVALLAS
ncbi:DNA cytosine methyltransferase [Brucella ciceri]|uniref:DNA cytosine methyltransferase n=1 Tax=Brucella ciceri TaxID=391287 RepID=UPI001F12D9E5|nr:DNA cytosine methyltransferase [Brucella ciceri]MCH6205250.1 DNA cytosine methyltransferase [Brucella ciceri]